MENKDQKQRILEAASELFMRFGIRSISMDDIANHLGMSKKTLYQHFSDKDQIVTLAIEEHLSGKKKMLEEIHEKADNIVSFIIDMNLHMRNNIKESSASVLHELRKYHPAAWKVLETFQKEFLYNMLCKGISKGIDDGLIRPEINPEVVARIRLEEVTLSFNEDIFPRTQFNIAEVSSVLLDHFVFGIVTEKGRKLYLKNKKQLETIL